MYNYTKHDRRIAAKMAMQWRGASSSFDAGPTPREQAEMACHNPNLGDFDEPTADNQEDSNNG